MKSRKILAEILRNYRLAHSLSQEKFAEICGVSADEVSLIECEKISPRFDTVWKIADALGMSMGEFFRQP